MDIFEAISAGNAALVTQILADSPRDAHIRSAAQLTPLHVAASGGDLNCAQILIDAGVDIDACDKTNGWTALHRALYSGHIAVAALLIQSGADTTIRDTDRRTAEEISCLHPLLPALPSHALSLVPSTVTAASAAASNAGRVPAAAAARGMDRSDDDRSGSDDNDDSGDEDMMDYKRSSGSSRSLRVARNGGGGGSVTTTAASASAPAEAVVERVAYTFGYCANHQLGYAVGNNTTCQVVPKRIDSFAAAGTDDASAAAANSVIGGAVSRFATYTVHRDGAVYACGMGANGRLGLSHSDTRIIPTRIESLYARGVSIASISCGNSFAVALTRTGQPFIWGVINCNSNPSGGASGSGGGGGDSKSNKSKSGAGRNKPAAATEQSGGLNIGSASSAAAITDASGDAASSAAAAAAVYIENRSIHFGATPRLLFDGSTELAARRIVKVVCSNNRCVLLTSGGVLFLVGKTFDADSGGGDQSPIWMTPRPYDLAQSLKALSVVDVAVSDTVIVALASNGALIQQRERLSYPQRVLIDYSVLVGVSASPTAQFSSSKVSDCVRQRMTRVAVCDERGLVLSTSGQLYGWSTDSSFADSLPGSNAAAGGEWIQSSASTAAAASGSRKEREIFARRIPGLTRQTVVDFGCCNSYSVALTESSEVYVWGKRCFIGQRVAAGRSAAAPAAKRTASNAGAAGAGDAATEYTQSLIRPTRIETLSQISRVIASASHMLVIQHFHHPPLPALPRPVAPPALPAASATAAPAASHTDRKHSTPAASSPPAASSKSGGGGKAKQKKFPQKPERKTNARGGGSSGGKKYSSSNGDEKYGDDFAAAMALSVATARRRPKPAPTAVAVPLPIVVPPLRVLIEYSACGHVNSSNVVSMYEFGVQFECCVLIEYCARFLLHNHRTLLLGVVCRTVEPFACLQLQHFIRTRNVLPNAPLHPQQQLHAQRLELAAAEAKAAKEAADAAAGSGSDSDVDDDMRSLLQLYRRDIADTARAAAAGATGSAPSKPHAHARAVLRSLRKKQTQCEALRVKSDAGETLTPEEAEKLKSRAAIDAKIIRIERQLALLPKPPALVAATAAAAAGDEKSSAAGASEDGKSAAAVEAPPVRARVSAPAPATIEFVAKSRSVTTLAPKEQYVIACREHDLKLAQQQQQQSQQQLKSAAPKAPPAAGGSVLPQTTQHKPKQQTAPATTTTTTTAAPPKARMTAWGSTPVATPAPAPAPLFQRSASDAASGVLPAGSPPAARSNSAGLGSPLGSPKFGGAAVTASASPRQLPNSSDYPSLANAAAFPLLSLASAAAAPLGSNRMPPAAFNRKSTKPAAASSSGDSGSSLQLSAFIPQSKKAPKGWTSAPAPLPVSSPVLSGSAAPKLSAIVAEQESHQQQVLSRVMKRNPATGAAAAASSAAAPIASAVGLSQWTPSDGVVVSALGDIQSQQLMDDMRRKQQASDEALARALAAEEEAVAADIAAASNGSHSRGGGGGGRGRGRGRGGGGGGNRGGGGNAGGSGGGDRGGKKKRNRRGGGGAGNAAPQTPAATAAPVSPVSAPAGAGGGSALKATAAPFQPSQAATVTPAAATEAPSRGGGGGGGRRRGRGRGA